MTEHRNRLWSVDRNRRVALLPRGWALPGRPIRALIGVVSEQQLHLFEPARPLLERFGAAFFKAVPPRPGVYIMSGEAERVLYIGQSGNLRQRLGSYKNARPDRAPRKVIRLIHSVRSLVWEECESIAAARLKEAQLLRVHRPRFNVQNTYPRAYRFISVTAAAEELALSLATEPRAEGKSFGAFKAGSTGAFGALLRLLWAAVHQPHEPYDFPSPLLQSRPPRDFTVRVPSPCSRNPALTGLMASLEALLGGESAELISLLAEAMPSGPDVPLFQRNLFAADLETLAGFYEFSAKRNRELRHRHGIRGTIIPQETLDDFLAVNLRGASADSE